MEAENVAPMNLSSPELLLPTTSPSELNTTNLDAVLHVIDFPRASTLFASVCCVIFIVVGCLGNLITIVALARASKLRNATTAFVISLCTADLIFCAFNLPLTASRYIHRDWLLGETLCQLFPFFFYGNVAASLMSMTAITINRLILINHYNLYDKIYQKRYVLLMIGLFWAFSFGIMMPPLVKVWGQLGFHQETFSCTILSLNGKSPKKFLFILGFLLPCLVIIISYSCIFIKVRRSSRKFSLSTRGGTVSPTEGPFSENRHQMFRKDELRLTRLMLIIFCSFLVCFLPLMIVNVFDNDITYPTVHVLASVLAWMSSAINPFIYAIFNRQYRQAYYQLIFPDRKLARNSSSTNSAGSKTRMSDVYVFNALTNKMEHKMDET